MEATYKLNANDLDEKFLKALKALFKDKTIFIKVEAKMDETDYLLATEANRKNLEEALNSTEGYSFTPEEFEELNKAMEEGIPYDTSKHRIKWQ